MELIFSWESASRSATQEYLDFFMELEVSLLYSQETSSGPYHEPDQSSIHYSILQYIRTIGILSSIIIIAYLLLAFSLKSKMHSSSPHARYLHFPPQPPWLVRSNYTWRRVQVTMYLIIQFSRNSYHSSPVHTKQSHQQPVLIHPQSVFLFSHHRHKFCTHTKLNAKL
jgi:hypothetical protein